MPYFDGTGPTGYGSGTGKGMGPCGAGMSRSFGCRRGFGMRGFRFTEQDLKERKEWLKAELQALEQEESDNK